jgi:hypothetical protein
MLWSPRSSANIKIWLSHQNVPPEVCQKVKKDNILSLVTALKVIIYFLIDYKILFLFFFGSSGGLNLTSDMVFFCWRMPHIRIHLVFQLQFFISSISCLKCIKLATQSCSSELDRYSIYLILDLSSIFHWV